jgi:hypothetical protein
VTAVGPHHLAAAEARQALPHRVGRHRPHSSIHSRADPLQGKHVNQTCALTATLVPRSRIGSPNTAVSATGIIPYDCATGVIGGSADMNLAWTRRQKTLRPLRSVGDCSTAWVVAGGNAGTEARPPETAQGGLTGG